MLTIRTWRSDTITAINSHNDFMNRYPLIEQRLTNELHEILRTLSSQHSESTVPSLSKDVIIPAIALAQKVYLLQPFSELELNATKTTQTQSASSIWTFKYSDYFKYPLGQFGARLPDFLKNIEDFRCINMSNRNKLLKPATDLTTKEKQDNLLYVLDIFPGLYCQRVKAGGSPPVSTISQPVLFIDFATNNTHTTGPLGACQF